MIYLDSAATSLQKPPEVARAVVRAMQSCASPGRGDHAAAMRAAETVFACREEAAALFHMTQPENVVFTMNATHALNIAVHSLVREGMRVAVSGFEHNAVMRPLYASGASILTSDTPLFDSAALIDWFERHLPECDAAVCTCVSNVFGFILPVREIAALCRRFGVPLIVDASQSAGILDLDFPGLGAAFAAMPGHKGLLGPQGTGILLCRHAGMPLLSGGTGGDSRSHFMPETLPERLEAGTHNVCGIAGLREGIRYIRRRTTQRIYVEEERLIRRLAARLNILPGLRVYYSDKNDQSGVLSVVPEKMSCDALSERLGAAGIAVRSGLHCAPLAHDTAGTLQTGTVRLSISPFNTPREIDRTADVIENILKNSYKL